MSDSVFFNPSRRSLFKLGGVVAGGAALAACSSSTTPGTTTSGGTETKLGVGNNGKVGAGRTGTAGDTLFIAGFQWGNPTTFNVMSPTAAWPASGNVLQAIFETPLRWNILTGEVMPGLAKSYKVDGTTITLTWQDNVTFSDGTPCTAKDAAYTYNTGKANTGLAIAAFFNAADSIEATDDKTLVVKVNSTSKNVGQVLRLLTENYVQSQAIVSKIATDKLATEIISTPVGTGPFTLGTADQTQVVLKRNDKYWGKDFYGGLPVMSPDHPPDLQGQRGRQPEVRQRRARHLPDVPEPDLEDLGGRQAHGNLPQGQAVLHPRQHADAGLQHVEARPRQRHRPQGDRVLHRLRGHLRDRHVRLLGHGAAEPHPPDRR